MNIKYRKEIFHTDLEICDIKTNKITYETLFIDLGFSYINWNKVSESMT